MTLKALAATVPREYIKSGTKGHCWNCNRDDIVILTSGICSTCYNASRAALLQRKSVADGLREVRVPRAMGRPRGPRRSQPVPAQVIPGGVKLRHAEARAIERFIATQCDYWSDTAQHVILPEARLLLAVIGEALANLVGGVKAKPAREKYKNAKQHRLGMETWEDEQRLAAESLHFLMTDRLEMYTDPLGLESSWVQRLVKKWFAGAERRAIA